MTCFSESSPGRNDFILSALVQVDPELLTLKGRQIAIVREAGVHCAVVSGVSSVFAAAAALQFKCTRPGGTQTLILTRRAQLSPKAHERPIVLLSRVGAALP